MIITIIFQLKQLERRKIGKTAIATALRGFNDLARSMTPTFKISVHGTSNPATLRLHGA